MSIIKVVMWVISSLHIISAYVSVASNAIGGCLKEHSFGDNYSFNRRQDYIYISAHLKCFGLFIQDNTYAACWWEKGVKYMKNFSSALPKDKNFAKLVIELKNHFEPKKAVIVEQFNFLLM